VSLKFSRFSINYITISSQAISFSRLWLLKILSSSEF
jgi:hypothetical protein